MQVPPLRQSSEGLSCKKQSTERRRTPNTVQNSVPKKNMAQLTSFPLQDRIRVFAADNTSMNTQLLVEALARDGQFHMAPPVLRESEVPAAVKRERAHIALISARQGNDSRAGFSLSREIRSGSPATRVI